LRQEEASKHREKISVIVLRLHGQGYSIDTIADIVAESTDSVQHIIDAQL
jgi:hypothetical protein